VTLARVDEAEVVAYVDAEADGAVARADASVTAARVDEAEAVAYADADSEAAAAREDAIVADVDMSTLAVDVRLLPLVQ
jgi:hypothetical protein